MVRRKPVRTRGKIPLSKYFQKFNEGDFVAVTVERAMKIPFPKTLQGKTGKVEDKRGKAYIVKINENKREKRYIIEPIHLKKIKNSN